MPPFSLLCQDDLLGIRRGAVVLTFYVVLSSRVDEYCCLGPPGRRGHTGGHRVEAYSNFPINGILMNLIM